MKNKFLKILHSFFCGLFEVRLYNVSLQEENLRKNAFFSTIEFKYRYFVEFNSKLRFVTVNGT